MPGDYYGFYHGNPLLVAPGKAQFIQINLLKVPDYFRRRFRQAVESEQKASQRQSLYPDNIPADFKTKLRAHTGLRGQLHSSSKEALHSGRIVLASDRCSAGTPPLAQSKTDENGRFFFPRLLPGVYYLCYQRRGDRRALKQDNGQEAIIVRYGQQEKTHRLFLRP